MAKEKKRSLMPKLRFPEFQDSGTWKNSKVADLLAVRQERRSPSDNTPLFSLTIEDGVTAKTDRYNREFLVSDTKAKLYKTVCPGDIVYNPSNLRWGAISQSRLTHSVVVSPIYEVLYLAKRDTADERFISAALTRPAQIKQFILKGQGTLVERIAVKIEFFLDTAFQMPESVKEQQKIADCLTSLDELIAAQGSKVDALKAFKKGLMQQLFPRKGEMVPRLRFPEFRDADAWKECALKDVVKSFKTGKLDANAMVDGGKYRFYTCAKSYYRIDCYAFDGEALLIAGNGAHLGYIHHYNGKFNAYQRTYVLQEFSANVVFLKWTLEKNLPSRIRLEKKEGNTPYIVLATLTDMPLLIPVDVAEQQRIADCLSTLDSRIAAETEKLAALKTHKNGLMQQLFPSPESV